MARRLRSPGDPEGGGSGSAGYSLTLLAERSPALTWLPGAAWVTELPKSPAARLAGDVWGSPTRERVPGFTSDAGVVNRLLPLLPIPLMSRSPRRARPTARGEAAWRLGRDGAGWTLQHAKSCRLLEIKTLIRNGWLEHSAPS